MSRMMRTGVVLIVVGLGLGLFSYVFNSTNQASVNGIAVKQSPTLFPPITIILLALGVILILVGYLRRTKAEQAPVASAPISGNPIAPAGWYPQLDGSKRFWDGQAWTDAKPEA